VFGDEALLLLSTEIKVINDDIDIFKVMISPLFSLPIFYFGLSGSNFLFAAPYLFGL